MAILGKGDLNFKETAASTSSNELQVATPRAGTALEELRRRFPTVSARSNRGKLQQDGMKDPILSDRILT